MGYKRVVAPQSRRGGRQVRFRHTRNVLDKSDSGGDGVKEKNDSISVTAIGRLRMDRSTQTPASFFRNFEHHFPMARIQHEADDCGCTSPPQRRDGVSQTTPSPLFSRTCSSSFSRNDDILRMPERLNREIHANPEHNTSESVSDESHFNSPVSSDANPKRHEKNRQYPGKEPRKHSPAKGIDNNPDTWSLRARDPPLIATVASAHSASLPDAIVSPTTHRKSQNRGHDPSSQQWSQNMFSKYQKMHRKGDNETWKNDTQQITQLSLAHDVVGGSTTPMSELTSSSPQRFGHANVHDVEDQWQQGLATFQSEHQARHTRSKNLMENDDPYPMDMDVHIDSRSFLSLYYQGEQSMIHLPPTTNSNSNSLHMIADEAGCKNDVDVIWLQNGMNERAQADEIVFSSNGYNPTQHMQCHGKSNYSGEDNSGVYNDRYGGDYTSAEQDQSLNFTLQAEQKGIICSLNVSSSSNEHYSSPLTIFEHASERSKDENAPYFIPTLVSTSPYRVVKPRSFHRSHPSKYPDHKTNNSGTVTPLHMDNGKSGDSITS